MAAVARLQITAGEIRQRMATSTADALRRALTEAIDERLLAAQAKVVLGTEVATGLDVPTRARRVAAELFSPHTLCNRIPVGWRRQHYDETRWRFIAPPAWTVDDTQLLCCKTPRECRHPPARACIDRRAGEAKALHAALKKGASLATLQATHAELFRKRYTFYFDPAKPGAKIDWRLQDVDLPIARAATALSPGQISAVVQTRFGWHVLRLVQSRPGLFATFEHPSTQAILRTELCPSLLDQHRRRMLHDLRQQTPIRIHDDALKSAFGALWPG